jgi:F0F1-type ATP synthase assembly protein I
MYQFTDLISAFVVGGLLMCVPSNIKNKKFGMLTIDIIGIIVGLITIIWL